MGELLIVQHHLGHCSGILDGIKAHNLMIQFDEEVECRVDVPAVANERLDVHETKVLEVVQCSLDIGLLALRETFIEVIKSESGLDQTIWRFFHEKFGYLSTQSGQTCRRI